MTMKTNDSFISIFQVSANGYVSLGKRYNARIPPKSSDSWPLDPPIIAPLWADIDPSLNDSGVYISQLRSDHNSENLKTLNAAIDFEPTFALMVTWKNAPPYPAVETLNSEVSIFLTIVFPTWCSTLNQCPKTYLFPAGTGRKNDTTSFWHQMPTGLSVCSTA